MSRASVPPDAPNRIRTRLARLAALFRPADQVVPPSGWTATLTVATSAAMAFLAVIALAFAISAGRVADTWSQALADSATLRISAPAGQEITQRDRALAILSETPGVVSARTLDATETQALLEPWFGPDLPLADLPIPLLIDVDLAPSGFDAEGLRLRLAAEVPGAILDDHGRWRGPLTRTAARMRQLGYATLGLIAVVVAAVVALAAQASLAANAQVIRVLRLIGARDTYVARAFTRRFSLRAMAGSIVGVAAGMAAVATLPAADPAGGLLSVAGLRGLQWAWPLTIVPLTGLVAFVATRIAAYRTLKGVR